MWRRQSSKSMSVPKEDSYTPVVELNSVDGSPSDITHNELDQNQKSTTEIDGQGRMRTGELKG